MQFLGQFYDMMQLIRQFLYRISENIPNIKNAVPKTTFFYKNHCSWIKAVRKTSTVSTAQKHFNKYNAVP